MTRKEIRNFAQKIAKLELRMRDASPAERRKIEEEMMELSVRAGSLDALMQIDEEAQEILAKEKSS